MKAVKLLLIILAISFFALSSCNKKSDTESEKKTAQDTLTQKLDPQIEAVFANIKPESIADTSVAPAGFRGKLNEVLLEYIEMKQALAKNDSTKALMKANQIKRTLTNIKTADLDDKMKGKWEDESAKIEKCCKEVTLTEKIDNQRKAFSKLTDIMTDIAKGFGFKNRTVYLIYCDDKKAGYWLVDSKDIENPYLGKLSAAEKPCAEVKEAWKFE